MKKQLISKISEFCFVALLLCSLVFVGAKTIISEKDETSFYENRKLAVFPEYTRETVLDGSYFSSIDTFLADHSAYREPLIKALTYSDVYLIKRPVVNQVVITDDVLLPHNEYEVVNKDDINAQAEVISKNILTHKQTAESYGGRFYYVAVPCQYVCLEDEYPWYLNNRSEYTKASSDALFSNFDENGIDYIDMYELYKENGSPETFTSREDNHYGILGGYDTYRALTERIKKDTNYPIEILDLEDLIMDEVPNDYLGSRARKIFDLWKIDEKLYTLTPKENIPFDRYDWGVSVNPYIYKMPAEDAEYADYDLYMGGNLSELLIQTHRDELPSILIYGDSFSNTVECITWCSFDNMYVYDFRYLDSSKGNLEQIINELKPEIVVCIRDYQALLTPYFNGQ